jgi:predicted Zn-dependent peptidase/outer membrane lipoprotein-sorting protein
MKDLKYIGLTGMAFCLVFLFSIQLEAQKNDEDFRWKAPEPAESKVIQMADYEQFELINGLKVILVENHKLPRVSYSLSLLHNPVLEGDKAGYVNITGDLLARGTESKTKAEIDEAIDFIGASFSTSANGMYGSSLTKHQDAMLEVLVDVLYNPSFPEDELQKIVTQTLSGLAQTKENPQSIANNVSRVVNFSKMHPYGEVETEASVKNVTVEDCKKYYQKYFRPDNAILTIVGDTNKKDAMEKVGKYFGKWEKPASSLEYKPLPEVEFPETTEVAFAQKEGAVQSYIQIVYPVDLKRNSPDAIKVSVMNTILGGGTFMGRLLQNLREDKAYTYSANSRISPDEHVADFGAYASVRNEVTDSAIVQFLYEMERMVKEPISGEDLKMAKSVLAGGFARSMESPRTIARFAYNTIRYNLPDDYYANYLQNLEAVTVEDVMEMSKKYIRPDKAYIVVVGNKDEVADKLQRFDDSGTVDYYDPFGNMVEMKNEAAPSDMTAVAVIENHISAIGGKANMDKVRSIKMVAGMSIMGQDLEMVMIRKDGKYYQKMGNQNLTIQEQIFDGEKAKVKSMAGNKDITEGPELDAIKKEAKLFVILDYFTDEYKLDLTGIEQVDGKDAYRIIAKDANGKAETMFFDKENFMLLKVVTTQEGNGQSVTVSSSFKEYQEVEGLMFPKKMSIVGGAPFPINLEFTTLEVNGEVDDSIFVIK